MKLTTKSRYGTRAMLDIALHSNNGPVQLKKIAKRQEISVKYLEQLLRTLKAAGLIRSIRGAQGGYLLNKKPGKITVFDIVNTLEGSLNTLSCIRNFEHCHRASTCVTRDIWTELTTKITELLNSITLENLIEKHAMKKKTHNYNI